MSDYISVPLHPDWVANRSRWQFVDDWYDGSYDRVIGYLRRYRTEAQDNPQAQLAWLSRRERADNDNELKNPIRIHLGHLCRPIDWGPVAEDPRFKEIIMNADGYRNSAKKVFKRVLRNRLLHGRVGVLIEGPEIAPNETRDQARLSGRSYQRVFTASSILNWSVFTEQARRGQLSDLLLFVGQETRGDEQFEVYWRYSSDGAFFTRQVLYRSTKHAFKIDDQGMLALQPGETIQGGISRIPFLLFGDGPTEEDISLMVAQGNRTLFNLTSVLDNILHYNGFERNIGIGVKPEEIKFVGENQMSIVSNPDAKFQTLTAADPQAIERRIERKQNRVRTEAMWDFNKLASEDSKQIQSQESKEQDVKSRIEMYNELLDEATLFLTDVALLHCEYENIKAEVKVQLSRDFGLQDPVSEQARLSVTFSQAGQLNVLDVQKAILKQNLRTSLDLKEEEMATLVDAVEAAKPIEPGLLDYIGRRGTQ